ncbi:hypothetical protein [Nonomuraea rosea]|uniref:hypothetical protein n=1 Tax=Nonomuraea rosea TaxID=638574 RepID=UPI0031EEFF59
MARLSSARQGSAWISQDAPATPWRTLTVGERPGDLGLRYANAMGTTDNGNVNLDSINLDPDPGVIHR